MLIEETINVEVAVTGVYRGFVCKFNARYADDHLQALLSELILQANGLVHVIPRQAIFRCGGSTTALALFNDGLGRFAFFPILV